MYRIPICENFSTTSRDKHSQRKEALRKKLPLVSLLSDDQNFAHVVAGQEELQRRKSLKEIFDVAVIEDPLKPKVRGGFQIEHFAGRNVIPAIGRIRTGIFGMKEGQEHTMRSENRVDTLDHGLDEGFVQVIWNVPTQDSVEVVLRIIQVFSKELFRIERFGTGVPDARFAWWGGGSVCLPGEITFVSGCAEDVLVINTSAKTGEKRNIGGGSWTEIEHGKRFISTQ